MIDLLCKFKLLCLNVDVKDNVNAIVTILVQNNSIYNETSPQQSPWEQNYGHYGELAIQLQNFLSLKCLF